jgi:hypothetical protein
MENITITKDTRVTIARLPSKTHRVEVQEGDTVDIVLVRNGERPVQANETVSVNGQPAQNGGATEVRPGDKVVTSQGAKGAA